MAMFFRCICGAEASADNDWGLPSGWERVCAPELCDTCSGQLHRFLSGKAPFEPKPTQSQPAPRRPLFDPLYRWHARDEQAPRAFECKMPARGMPARGIGGGALCGNVLIDTLRLCSHMVREHGLTEDEARAVFLDGYQL